MSALELNMLSLVPKSPATTLPGVYREHIPAPHPGPEPSQRGYALEGRVGRQMGGVEGAGGRPEQQVRVVPSLDKGSSHPDLSGSKAGAPSEHPGPGHESGVMRRRSCSAPQVVVVAGSGGARSGPAEVLARDFDSHGPVGGPRFTPAVRERRSSSWSAWRAPAEAQAAALPPPDLEKG